MWKLTNKAKGKQPLPGVPWRDMDDDEFKDVAKMYASQGWPDRALHNSGFFDHVEEKATKSSSKEPEAE